jgi:DNA-binding PucR family transcriptional regulator
VGCDLARPHVLVHGEHAGGNGAGADWEAVATRLGARLRGRDQAGFFDAGRHGLRAVVMLPQPEAAERVIRACDALASSAHVVLGVSVPGRGIAASRQALRESQRAAQIAMTLRPGGGALGYEQLGAYKYLVDLRLDETPRDRHWTAVQALLAHDAQRRTVLLDTLEEYLARRRSVADTARALYIHSNTLRQRLARVESVTGLELDGEDLLALELAVKLVRLGDARRRAGA